MWYLWAMKINVAHLQDQGVSFAVFDANASDGTDRSRASLLARLTSAAIASGLKVEKAALAYSEFGQLKFYGTPDLVRYLTTAFQPQWTHSIDVP